MHPPNINPIIFQIGPLTVHWYGLAYLAGIICAGLYIKKRFLQRIDPSIDHYITFLSTILIGIIIGGRLGYVIFYDFSYFLSYPIKMIAIWEGGMSFHGGLIGILIATGYEVKKNNYPYLKCLDLICLSAPIGLFFGRIANFINHELVGRITSMKWGVIFPAYGAQPRHPSQLYEALCEGLLLGIVLFLIDKKTKKPGLITIIFTGLYGLSRFIIEFFRAPDPQIGFLWLNLTLGQYLCLGMIIISIILYYISHIKSKSL